MYILLSCLVVRLMIRAIIFDYYGVMCPRIAPMIARETAKQFDIPYKSVEPVTDELLDLMDDNSITFYEYWRLLKRRLKKADVRLPDHRKIWKECTLNLGINPRMKNLIKRLKEVGYRVPVLTNVSRKMAEYNKAKGRYKSFKPVFLSYEIRLKKPSPKIFLHVLKKLKLKSDECIFIDDKENYLKGARAAGIKTILFKSFSQLESKLRRAGINGI